MVKEKQRQQDCMFKENGSGKFFINNQAADKYFQNDFLLSRVKEPLLITNFDTKKYDLLINVKGGGKSSQVDTIRQAIARAICEITKDPKIKEDFLEYDRSLLVSDVRRKEANKPNNSAARAKRQKSYR